MKPLPKLTWPHHCYFTGGGGGGGGGCRWSLMKPRAGLAAWGTQLGGASWGSLGDLLPVDLRGRQVMLLMLLFGGSAVSNSVTPWTAARQSSPSFTISRSLFKLMSIEVTMPSNHLILCHPLLLPSICHSMRVFSNESALHIKWPKYWSFSFSISPSNEYSGLISFRIGWLDLHESKGLSRVFSSTTVQKHQFFSTQLSLWSDSQES